MINSLKKGKRGEREFVQFCKKHGFLEVRRGQQYSGIEGEDIVGLPFIHVEVKFYGKKEDLNIQKALEQAIRDADDKIPVVAWRINHQRGWNIVMRTVDFVNSLPVYHAKGNYLPAFKWMVMNGWKFIRGIWK